ncbi:MAG: hypothetical protein IJB57_02555, partial [Clostridia bacterium]|nr:hypothetical protein [Clostridia bacterium]
MSNVFYATNNHKKNYEQNVFKATSAKSYDPVYLNSLQRNNEDNFKKLQEYQTRRSNNEYMTADEIAGYRAARNNYSDSYKRLSEITRSHGGQIDTEYEKQQNDWLESVGADLDNDEKIFSGFKNAEEYNKAVKDYTYRSKYQGKTYSELQKAISELDTGIKTGSFESRGQGGLMRNNAPVDPAKTEELEWLKNYAKTDRDVIDGMTVEELEGLKAENKAHNSEISNRLAYLDKLLTENRRALGRGHKVEGMSLTEIQNERRKLRDEEKNSDVLYFDESLGAVTIDNLVGIRRAEADIDKVLADPKAAEMYTTLTQMPDDEEGITALYNAVNVPGAVPDANVYEALRQHPEGAQLIATAEKYGIDLTKGFGDVRQQVFNLSYGGKYGDELTKLGYNWDDMQYYLDYMRSRESYAEKMKEKEAYAKKHPVLATARNIVAAPAQVFDLIGNIGEKPYGLTNVYDDDIVNTVNTSTGAVAEKIDESIDNDVLGWLASTAYSGVTSSLQSAATGVACTALFGPAAGPAISLGILGSQAAASSFNEAIKNGSTNGQALGMAIVSGVAEAAFEKLPLDNLFAAAKGLDTSSVKKLIWSAVKQTGKQSLIEGLEEAGTNIVNTIADGVINGDHSRYNTTVEKLVREGYSREEAKQIAAEEWLKELRDDFFGGVFGGLSSGGTANTVGTVANYSKARANGSVSKIVGSGVKADTGNLEGLVKTAEVLKDNSDVAKALKDMNRRGSELNVGILARTVNTALKNEFSKASTVEELESIKSKFGDGNSYVERAYGEEYERITGEIYVPKVTATPAVEIAEGNATHDLQSNAVPSYESFERSGKTVAYTATTAEGRSIKVYGVDSKTGKLNTSAGAVGVNDVSFGDTAVSQLFKNALSYEAPVADLYIGAYDPERTSVKNYNMAFEGLYGEGSVIGAGKNFEQAYKLYGKIGGMNIHTARVIYDAGENETLIKRQTQQKTNAENKKTATPKGITGEVTESSTGSLTDRERAIYNTIATEFKVDIDVVSMTGDGSLGYTNTVTRRIVSSLASGNRISTLLHESGHIMKAWALDTYNEIQDAVVSWYEKHTDKALDKLIEARQKSYAEKGEVISPEEALDEVTNNALEAIQRAKEFDKTFVKSMAEDGYTKTEAKSIIAKLKAFFEKLKTLFRKVNSDTKTKRTDTTEMITAEGKSIADIANDIEMMDKLLDLFVNGMNEVRDNYDSYVRGEREGVSDNSAKSQQLTEDEDKLAGYDKSITMNDVKLLRTIIASHNGERVSINDFTAEDIEKAQKWAYKFYKELGVKSPFFRAWFGDWRAHSTDLIVETEIDDSLNIASGNAFNEDMKRKFSWDKISGGESIAHSPAKFKSEMKVLAANMPEIVKNAIYFDTQVSDKSSKRKLPGTAFMHCLYSVVNHNGKKYLIKLYGEEAFSEKSSEIFTRAYSLKYIKKIADIDSSVLSENGGLTESQSATIKSISELFDLVKTYDSEFNPNPVHESMIEKGQPKVFYHGSPAQFTAFDKKKARSMGHYGRGFYFSDSKSHAGTYGNTYSVYLNIVNPLKEGESKVTRDQVKDYLERVAENEDYSIENYGTYDIDTILDRIFEGTNEKDAFAVIQDINATAIGDMVEAAKLFNEVNGTSFDGIIVPTETVAFEPEQIKSATWSKDLSGELDNIGTFSKYDSDIRHQHLTSAEQEQKFAQETAEQIKTLKDINKSLTAKNTAQAKMIESLKGQIRQWQNGGEKKLDYRGMQKVARKLISETGAKIDAAGLTKKLEDLFNYMASEKPSAEQIKKTMTGIANEIIGSASAVDNDVAEQIHFIRGKLKNGVRFNEQQKGDVKHRFGSMAEYKAFVGSSVRISEKGIPLDDIWSELSDKYPNLFREDITDADQPIEIADVLNTLGNNRTYNPFYREYMGDVEHAVMDVCRMIIEGYHSVPELVSTKSAYNSAFAKAKAEFDEAQAESKKAYSVRIEQLKNNYQGTLNAIAYENSQKYKDYRDARSLTEEKNKVKRIMKLLYTTLAESTKTKYAPVKVYKALVDVCEAIDLGHNLDTKLGQRMAFLQRKYLEMLDNEEILADYKSEFSERIYKNLNNITNSLGDRSIAELSYKEMYQLRTALEDVTHTLTEARRQIGTEEFVENYSLGMQMIEEVKESPDASKLSKLIGGAALNPMNAAEMMSGYNPDSVIMKLFERLRKGVREQKQYKMDASKPFDKLMAEKEYKAFINEEIDVGLYDTNGH